MAAILGLTKGAVSQTLSRLAKKGIILKTKDPCNKNELRLFLTDLGQEAYDLCQTRRELFIDAHKGHLATLNAKEKKVILDFLLHLEKAIDDLGSS